jgi:hypothetical protein
MESFIALSPFGSTLIGTLKGTLGPEDEVGREVVDEPGEGQAVGWQ